MENEHTAESRHADQILNESLSHEPPLASTRRAAIQRHLADFEDSADTNINPLGGVLTHVISGAAGLTIKLSDAIRQALPETTATLEDLERVKTPFDNYMRVARQTGRFADLQLKLQEKALIDAERVRPKRSGIQRISLPHDKA